MTIDYRARYAAHVNEVQARWEAAIEAEQLGGVLVHSGSPLISFLDDNEYPFRPNPHFLAWLPLTRHHDSALLIVPGERPRLFYYQPVDYWYLPPSDPEPWWADHFEIEIVRETLGWKPGLQGMIEASPGRGPVAAIGDAPSLFEVFPQARINPAGLLTRLHLARTRKTPYEVACIDAASRLAAVAHREAERAFREGCSEFQIHQRYLASCAHTDYELPYNNIVALNTHGSALHYQARERSAPESSRSFLIDAGCTVNAYASDITRTHAREEGVFSGLIGAMDLMQQALIERVHAGLDYRELHLQAHHEIAAILADFGIIDVAADDAVESGLSAVFYPHGLGHFIGLQTHDVAGLIDNEGEPIPRPDGHPFLRLTRRLEPGNVLTIEPGLYFIAPLLERWRSERNGAGIDWELVERLAPYGGIRIEDNILVTEDGCENLTRRAFESLG